MWPMPKISRYAKQLPKYSIGNKLLLIINRVHNLTTIGTNQFPIKPALYLFTAIARKITLTAKEYQSVTRTRTFTNATDNGSHTDTVREARTQMQPTLGVTHTYPTDSRSLTDSVGQLAHIRDRQQNSHLCLVVYICMNTQTFGVRVTP